MTSKKHSSAFRFLAGAVMAILVATLIATSAPAVAQREASGSPRWIGAWSTGLLAVLPPPAGSPAPPAAAAFPSPPRVANQTLRQIVRVSIGGTQIRVALTNRFGGIALIPASERGHVEVVRYLLDETDVDVDHVNNLGWTALLEAVILGNGGPEHQAIVRLLLDAGADPELADKDGVTPLAHARARGQAEIAAILVEAGAER